jgi:hypothetical protein
MEAIEINENFSQEGLIDAALAIANNPFVANMYLLSKMTMCAEITFSITWRSSQSTISSHSNLL